MTSVLARLFDRTTPRTPLTLAETDALFAELAADPRTARFPPEGYEEYLKSPLWRAIRKRVLERDRRVCFRCKGKATQVHHRAYDTATMEGRDDTRLVSLCSPCHRTVHFVGKGKPRESWQEFERVLTEPPDALTPWW